MTYRGVVRGNAVELEGSPGSMVLGNTQPVTRRNFFGSFEKSVFADEPGQGSGRGYEFSSKGKWSPSRRVTQQSSEIRSER
jgi:hypothetical protein